MAEGTTDSVRFFIDADSSPQRYAILSEQTFPHFAGTPIDGVKVTLGKIGISDKDVAYGKTKLFVRDPKTLYAAEVCQRQCSINTKSNVRMQDARLKALDMIAAKVKSAKCPAKKVEGNICLEYAHLLIFEELDEFTIRRPPGKNGENNDVVYKVRSARLFVANRHSRASM